MTRAFAVHWQQRARAHAATLAWGLWVALCAALLLNWHRAALSPADMNPVQLQRLAGVWLLLLALAVWRLQRTHRHAAAWTALVLSSATTMPADMWMLGAAIAVSAALCIRAGAPGGRQLGWALAGLLALVSLLGAYERIFGRVTADSLSTVFQTHPAEAGSFLAHLVTPGWIVNQSAWLVSLVLVSWRSAAAAGGGKQPALPTLVVSLALLAAGPGLLARALAFKQGLQAHAQHKSTVTARADLPQRVASSTNLDVIWVIGESQSRWAWSLYGYPRRTTPRLAAMQDELVVMRDAVAPHSYTVQALLETLYRPMRADQGQSVGSVGLVDLLRSAGVAVHWHSGQERFGPWATPVVTAAARAETVDYFGSHLRLPLRTGAPSEHADRLAQAALLARLASGANGSGPTLLVHHMIAAHDPYCAHVPLAPPGEAPGHTTSPTAWFGAAVDRSASLRCYEGAVQLTDEIVARYIDVAQQRAKPTIVLFVPDHGEAPEEGSGHNADRPSARHLDIPVILGFNAAARQAYPAAWDNLRRHAGAPYLGSWTFELLLDLFQVPAGEVALRAPSPATSPYRPPARIIYPNGRRWNYDALQDAAPLDLLAATRKALAKPPSDGRPRPPLYAHRVNTVLKGLEAARFFDGIELDIVMDAGSGVLIVNHPPMPRSGLTLAQLLQAIAFRPDLRLWLDFKNAEQAAPAPTIALLKALDAQHGLQQRSVLELPWTVPDDSARAYAAAGWRVSIYLPDDLAACAVNGAGQQACAVLAAEVLAKAQRVGARAISFDDVHRSVVDRYLRPKAPGLQYLTWKLSLRSDNPQLAELAADLQPIDALIVAFPSPFSP